MCTALTLQTKDHYFGRNLDLEYAYHETITITPRNYPFRFCNHPELPRHYAMIGMAYIQNDYPLYYEATNEAGLSIAGLNFPGNACYFPPAEGKLNLSPYELIPYLLGTCKNITEVKALLPQLNLCNIPFCDSLPLSPLHWIISDRDGSLTVESLADGLHIHKNTPGVLTNNPPFDYHLLNLTNFMGFSPAQPENNLTLLPDLTAFSHGTGAFGLPGDLSSASRFVRAVFLKSNSICDSSETASVHQFFHILDNVAHPRGSVEVSPAKYQITVYSCCCNTDKGIYYYKTYENSTITAVDLHREPLDTVRLISYSLNPGKFVYQN